jgi:hypothetical protein
MNTYIPYYHRWVAWEQEKLNRCDIVGPPLLLEIHLHVVAGQVVALDCPFQEFMRARCCSFREWNMVCWVRWY